MPQSARVGSVEGSCRGEELMRWEGVGGKREGEGEGGEEREGQRADSEATARLGTDRPWLESRESGDEERGRRRGEGTRKRERRQLE